MSVKSEMVSVVGMEGTATGFEPPEVSDEAVGRVVGRDAAADSSGAEHEPKAGGSASARWASGP